jgi:hypothetical protein
LAAGEADVFEQVEAVGSGVHGKMDGVHAGESVGHGDMVTVVGPALCLPTIKAPTQADIDHWHGRYMEELHCMFERNKGKYAAESSKTELVML